MPIYAYKCSSCGFAEDVLQKLSDAPLTDCPSCGAAALHKQVTAASFRLKGSGWYVTDFRNEGAAPGTGDKTDEPAPHHHAGESAHADSGVAPAAEPAPSAAAAAPAPTPAAAPAPTPAPAPAAGGATATS